MLKFLLDHNIPKSVGTFLVNKGHDTVFIGSIDREMPDADIANLALVQERIIVTNDKDFLSLFALYPDLNVILFDLSIQGADVRVQSLERIMPELEMPCGILIIQ